MNFKDYDNLKNWYQRSHRRFSWRLQENNLYEVLVREVMSQQTILSVALAKMKTFLERFPSVEALAGSSEEEVFQAWQGLGYYRRASLLKKAAQEIVESGWPKHYEEWRQISGVGPYTAAMLSSLSSSQWTPAIDGNVFRTLSRYFGWKESDHSSSRLKLQKHLQKHWSFLEGENPNEMLIELGALICRSQTPQCLLCPLQKNCQALASGNVKQFPLAKVKKQKIEKELFALVFSRKENIVLEKREDGFLKKTWGIPLRNENLEGLTPLTSIQHHITKYRLLIHVCFLSEPLLLPLRQFKEVPLAQINESLTTSLDLKVIRAFESHQQDSYKSLREHLLKTEVHHLRKEMRP
jgi:A/G-specific adenine glycosylase